MADARTLCTPRMNYLSPRGKSFPFNRCISSNITMVHGEDGKAAVVSKQSTFSIVNDVSGSINIKRIEGNYQFFYGLNDLSISVFAERCEETSAEDDDDASSVSSDFSQQSSESSSLSCSSGCRSPLVPIFCVKSSYAKTSHDALRLALGRLGWNERSKTDGTFDFYWHGIAYEDTSHENVADLYAINKLPGMLEISHKVQLSRILKRMENLYPGEFNFYPPSWVIPDQFHQFIAEVSASPKTTKSGRYTPDSKNRRPSTPRDRTFIVKPDQGRQGEGIYLVTDPRDIRSEVGIRPSIVQEYIDKPLLIDGYKFDMRIYVVVARLDPIEIYLCKEGLARLCTSQYEYPTKQNIGNTFMHLTNYSLNKNSDDFVQTDAANTGSKRTLSSVEELLMKKGYDIKKMRMEIRQLAVKTILAVLPDLTIWNHASGIPNSTRCFQILGFDVMLTSDMKAYLLEVNAVPSLRIDAEREVEPGVRQTIISAVDEMVKVTLIKDTLELIALGEDNIDMSMSCLKRIYPIKGPHDPPKNFREFRERIRLCDKSCQEHSMHASKKSASLAPRTDMDSRMTEYRRRPAWFCNRHCPHCHVTILRKKPIAPIVIKLNEKRESYHSMSDWRFFDHEHSGSSLLRSERQPMTNISKPRIELSTEQTRVENEFHDENEPYRKCPNCGGYLSDTVGPGIMLERTLLNLKADQGSLSTNAKPALGALAMIESEENFFNGIRDFKLTPAHTRHFLPLHNTGGLRSGTGSRNLLASNGLTNSFTDNRSAANTLTLGKRTADQRKKETLFSGYHVMLLRRCAKVFIYFNGIKASLTMGATSFRNMARKCNLCDQGALPSIDILYIDAIRQWQSYRAAHGTPYFIQNSERKDLKTKKERLRQATGLPFHGFIDALVRIASQRYRGEVLRDKMEQLINECEKYIAGAKKIEKEERLKLKAKRGTLLSPWEKQTSLKQNGRPKITRTLMTQQNHRSRLTSQ